MLVELHCHTSEYSACSHVNAAELIKRAYDMGMQAIVITDHHYQWQDDDLIKVKQLSGVPDNFVVLAGEEFKTSDYGDILIYGLKSTLKKQKLTLEQVRKENPDAAIIWAHPYRDNRIPLHEKLLNPLLDGIEIFSSNYTIAEARRALNDWHELKFTAIAGTDTHALSYTGSYPTIFDHPLTSMGNLICEIKAGRCRPYFKEIPLTGTTDVKVSELTLGKADPKPKIIIKTFDNIDAWKEGERTFHLVNEIYKNGFDKGPYRVSKPLEQDAENLSIMEQSIVGKTLYDKIVQSDPETTKKYLKMAAGWLAEFHNKNFRFTPAEEYLSIEKDRLKYYLSKMYENNHPHTARAQEIADQIWNYEQELIINHPEILTQGHGDYHPKNIIISVDNNEEFLGVIDFNSSYQLPRAFDVGSFLAQYKNMLFDSQQIYINAPPDIFYEEYVSKAENLPQNFYSQVQLYKARACLSIIYYLVKVGKGDSENFWTVMVGTERNLADYAFRAILK